MKQDKERNDKSVGATIDRVAAGYDYTAAEEEHLGGDPNAPLRLAVLGPQDDLSTIAGDTITDSVVTSGAVFSSANLPRTIQTARPVQRDFKEYEVQTPTKAKKKRWHPYGRRENDDEQTQPETPVGVVGVPILNKDEDGEKDGETWASDAAPSKKMYICAGVFACVLLLLIVGLGVAYTAMNGDNDGATKSVSNQQPEYGGFSPEDLVELTQAPTDPPDEKALSILLSLLKANGILDPESLLGTQTPQGRAIVWVAADPNFDDYTESRLIQRYFLAVFAFGLEANDDAGNIRSLSDILPKWLDYNINECDWDTTLESDPVCDGFGFYTHLELADKGLWGTFPTEISLLSNSLVSIDLRGNQLAGSIPSELSSLALLQSCVLSTNMLTGEVPTQLGTMERLSVFSVGQNSLTGAIPSQIGQMRSLSRLLLPENMFDGFIPEEIGMLANLVTLDLSGNNLSGALPFFGNLTVLSSLNLQHNNLTGPVELCDLSSLAADCHLMDCPCCTACTETPMPTAAPTWASNAPTLAPTRNPTPQPTECLSRLEWVSTCVLTGDPFEVRFSNCQPEPGDWIGIFDKDADPTNLPNPYLWTWSCGSQTCRESPREGVVRFNEASVDDSAGEWPLWKGDYHAYMIRNSGNPIVAFLSTDRIKMKDDRC